MIVYQHRHTQHTHNARNSPLLTETKKEARKKVSLLARKCKTKIRMTMINAYNNSHKHFLSWDRMRIDLGFIPQSGRGFNVYPAVLWIRVAKSCILLFKNSRWKYIWSEELTPEDPVMVSPSLNKTITMALSWIIDVGETIFDRFARIFIIL